VHCMGEWHTISFTGSQVYQVRWCRYCEYSEFRTIIE